MHASSGRVRHLVRLLALGLLAAATATVAGCGASAGGRPPVDSPIYAFQPADPDDFADDEEESEDEGDDDGDPGDVTED
jgi:hypothetical protein